MTIAFIIFLLVALFLTAQQLFHERALRQHAYKKVQELELSRAQVTLGYLRISKEVSEAKLKSLGADDFWMRQTLVDNVRDLATQIKRAEAGVQKLSV